MEQIRSLMRERRKLAENADDNFNVMDTKQIAETLSGTIGTMTGCSARWPPSACSSAASAS
jgi:putative ABC transport system permease protein